MEFSYLGSVTNVLYDTKLRFVILHECNIPLYSIFRELKSCRS